MNLYCLLKLGDGTAHRIKLGIGEILEPPGQGIMTGVELEKEVCKKHCGSREENEDFSGTARLEI